jgi:hypothetical protein
MRRGVATSNLTKDYIESKISQESIMSKYLGIPIEVIKDCIEHNHLITSIFRDDDTNKSMGFAYNSKGKLKVRDFGGVGLFMDIYDTVAYVLGLAFERKIETNNKQDFYFVLKHIAYTFSDIIDGKTVDPSVNPMIANAIAKGKKRKAIIDIVPRSWNKYDKDIWARWGIPLNYLNTHFVLPVEQYYINRGVNSEPKYYYKAKDPCYAYMFGHNRQGIALIKLYFPKRNRSRELKFITNCNVLEGLPNLELSNYDYVIITKSTKDRLSLGAHLQAHPLYGGGSTNSDNPLRIGVINLPSENYRLKQNEYDWISNKLADNGMILSFLDFDETGRNGAKYLKDTYGIPYLFITRGEFGLPNFECKDFSDLHDKFSIKEIDTFIKDTLKYVELRFKTSDYSSTCESGLLSYNLPY